MRNSIRSALLKRLYGYWMDMKNGHEVPLSSSLDPLQIHPQILPHIMLLDVEEGGHLFKFRLLGTEVVKSYGEEVTGQYLNSIDLGNSPDNVIENYREVVSTREPIWFEGSYSKACGKKLTAERLVLPLSIDGQIVTRILCGIIFSQDLISPSDSLLPPIDRLPVRNCKPQSPESD